MERKLLSQLREKFNLTYQELADDLHISKVYVRKIEKGAANPGRNTMIKYEAYFKKDMKELFPDLFFNACDKKVIKKKSQRIS